MLRRRQLDAYHVYLILTGASSVFLWFAFAVNMVFQVEQVGLNPLQLVLVGTVLEASYFLFEVPTGVVADVYSRRLSVIIGIFLLGAGVVLAAVPSFVVILVSQVVMGIGYTFMSGAQQAWIADEIGEEQAGRAYLRGSQMEQLGGLIGVPLATALATVQLNLPIVVGGVLMIALGAVLVFTMPEHGFTPVPRDERGSLGAMRDTLVTGAGVARRKPVLLTILGIAAFFGMFSEGFDRLSTAHFLEDFTFPSIGSFEPVVWIGGITVLAIMLKIASAEIVRRRVDTNSHRQVSRLLFALDALLIVGVIGFALAGNFAVAVITFLSASVLRGISYPLKDAWVNQNVDPRVRATVMSMSGQADALGQIVGGPGIGAIGTAFSLRAALLTAGLVLAPSLVLYLRALGQGEEPMFVDERVVAAETSRGASTPM